MKKELPVAEWVEVAAFGEEAEDSYDEGLALALAMEERRVSGIEDVIEPVAAQEPRQVGIDPFNTLIDRNPGNNLVRVREGGR